MYSHALFACIVVDVKAIVFMDGSAARRCLRLCISSWIADQGLIFRHVEAVWALQYFTSANGLAALSARVDPRLTQKDFVPAWLGLVRRSLRESDIPFEKYEFAYAFATGVSVREWACVLCSGLLKNWFTSFVFSHPGSIKSGLQQSVLAYSSPTSSAFLWRCCKRRAPSRRLQELRSRRDPQFWFDVL